MRLRPSKGITGAQLINLTSLFPRTSQLLLMGSESLADSRLVAIQAFSHLTHVFFWECNWLTDVGIAHLAPLSCLEVLTLAKCKSLSGRLPDCISTLTALKVLKISACDYISSLPESIRALTALSEIELVSASFHHLPEGIQYLTALKKVTVHNWNFFCHRPIPAGISFLYSLERLDD